MGVSDSITEINKWPYHPISDIPGAMVTQILGASGPYPGDLLYPQSCHNRFTVY